MMKALPVTALFMAATLTGCADLDMQQRPVSAAADMESYLRHPQEWKRRQAMRPEFAPRTAPRKLDPDVQVVDYDYAPPEIKEACTKVTHEALTLQPASFGGDSSAVILYDVAPDGYPVNIRVSAETKGTDLIKTAAVNDMEQTRFQPPVYNGVRLYCRNLRDTFTWSSPRHPVSVTTRERNGKMAAYKVRDPQLIQK